ncbi:MAG: hypothetical protein M1837_002281 [Sclerophora amabilis]|nr:MAG: hypothetical protein M1837_002281 [Sclerophora amabilis]
MALTPPGDIPKAGMLAIVWIGFAVAAILTAARLYIRHVKLRRFFWDDAFHVFALVTLLTSAFVYSWMVHVIYDIGLAVTGMKMLDVKFFDYDVPQFFRYQFGTILLFWITLWSVKISFLLFYRRFFDGLTKHIIAWWLVMIFTVGAFIGCCITFLTVCGTTANWFKVVQCGTYPSLIRMAESIKFSTAVDIISDVMIMALPLRILCTLRITTRQKIGLAGLFSLAIIIITFAIVRAAKSSGTLVPNDISSLVKSDPTTLTLYTILEATVAVIVSCLPTFRVLFVNHSDSNPANSPPLSFIKPPSYRFYRCPGCGRARHGRWLFNKSRAGSTNGNSSLTAVCSPRSDCSNNLNSFGSGAAAAAAARANAPTEPKALAISKAKAISIEEEPVPPMPPMPKRTEMSEIKPKPDINKPLPAIPSRCSSQVIDDEEAQRGEATALFRSSGLTMEGESYAAFMRALNRRP